MAIDEDCPRPHKLIQISKLFGLFRIRYFVENRRPVEGDKFKHFIDIRFLWWRFNWTMSTKHPYDDLPYTD